MFLCLLAKIRADRRIHPASIGSIARPESGRQGRRPIARLRLAQWGKPMPRKAKRRPRVPTDEQRWKTDPRSFAPRLLKLAQHLDQPRAQATQLVAMSGGQGLDLVQPVRGERDTNAASIAIPCLALHQPRPRQPIDQPVALRGGSWS